MADPIREEVTFDSDGSERAVAAELERALETALKRAFQGVAREMRTAFQQASGSGRSSAFAGPSRDADRFTRRIQQVQDQLDRFNQRLAAMRRNASNAFDIGEFANINHQLLRMDRLVDDVGDEWRTLDVEARKALETMLRASRGTGFLDLGTLQIQSREVRRATQLQIAEQQRLTRIAERESRERVVAAQQEGARQLAATRAATQRRVVLIQAAAQQIRAAERGLAAVFRTTASAISAAFRGAGSVFSSFARRMSREAATSGAVVRREMVEGLQGSLTRRESILRSSFRRQETAMTSSITRQTAQLQRFERILSTGALGAVSGRSATAAAFGLGGLGAVAGGAGLFGLLTTGFRRFAELEALNRQFIALTGNAEQAAALMAEVKDFARITPFDVTGVASLAKGFLAIGTAADQVLPQVRTIADAVALTGGGTEELERIQRAIGQVVSAGRLQGDELNQLAENLPGLNIRQILADQLTGGDVQALVKMQEAGELTADKFVTGLMTGLSEDPRLQGASEALGSTLGGQFANLREGFADFGASLISLVATQMRQVFSLIATGLQGLSQFITGENLSAFFDTLRTAVGGAVIAIGGLVVARVAAQALQLLAVTVRGLLTPMGFTIAAVAAVGAAIAVLVDKSDSFAEAIRSTGRLILSIFGVVGDVIGQVFLGAGEAAGAGRDAIADFAEEAARRLTEFNERLSGFIEGTLRPTLLTAATAVRGFFIDTVIPAVRAAYEWVRDVAVPALQDAFQAVSEFIRTRVTPAIVAGFQFVREEVFPIVADVARFLADFLDDAADFVVRYKEIFAPIGGGLAGFLLGGLPGAAIGAGIGAIIGNFERIQPAIQPAIDAVVGFIDTTRDSGLRDALSNLGNGIAESFGNIGRAITSTLGDVRDRIVEFIEGIDWVGLGESALDFVETVGRVIGTIVSSPAFVGALASIAAAAALVVFRFGEGIIKGIQSNLDDWFRIGLSGLTDVIRAILTPEGFVAALGVAAIGALLRNTFREIGQHSGQGFIAGLRGVLSAGGGTVLGAGRGGGTSAFLQSLFGGRAAIQAGIRRQMVDVQRTAVSEIQRMRRIVAAAGATTPTGASINLLDGAAVRRQFDELAGQIGPSGIAGLRLRAAVQDTARAITQGFRGVSFREGLSNLMGELRNLGGALVGAARQVGTQIAAAIGAGIAGFQVGRSAAQSGGVLEGLLSVGAIAAPIAAISGPAGVAAAAVGALGVAIGNAGRAAKKAAEETQEYVDAIGDLEGGDLRGSLINAVRENLENESVEVRTILADLGFFIQDFVRRVALGGETAGSFLADMIGDLGPTFAQVASDLASGALSIDEFVERVTSGGSRFRDFRRGIKQELDAAGIDFDDFLDVIDAVFDESNEIAAAFESTAATAALLRDEVADAERPWEGLRRTMADTKDIVDRLPGSMSNVRNAMLDAKDPLLTLEETAARLPGSMANISNAMLGLTPPPSKPKEGLEEIDRTARDAELAVSRLRDRLAEAFGVELPSDFEEDFRKLIASLDSINVSDLNLNLAVDRAQFEGQVNNIVSEFVRIMSEGIENGEITSIPQINARKEELLSALNEQLLSDGKLDPIEAELLLNVTALLGTIDDSNLIFELERRYGSGGPDPNITGRPNTGQRGTPALGLRGGGGGGGGGGFTTAIGVGVIVTPTNITFEGFDEALFGPQVGIANLDVWIPTTIIPTPISIGAAGAGAKTKPGTGGGLSVTAADLGLSQLQVTVPVLITPSPILIAPGAVNASQGLGQLLGIQFAAGVRRMAPAAAQAGATVANGARAGLQSGVGPAGAVGQVLGVAFASRVAAMANAARGSGTTVARAAVGGLNTQHAAASAAGQRLGSSFATGVARMIGAARSAGGALARAARSGAAGGGSLFSAGATVALSFTSGINSRAAQAANAARTMVTNAIKAARAAAGIASPSKVFMQIGREIGEGLAIGIADSEAEIESVVRDAVSSAVEAAMSQMDRAQRAVNRAAGELFEILQPTIGPGGGAQAAVRQAQLDARSMLDKLTEISERIADNNAEVAEQKELLDEKLSENNQRIAELTKEAAQALADVNSRDARIERALEGFRAGEANIEAIREGFNLQGLARDFREGFEDFQRQIAEARAKPAAERSLEEQRLAGLNALSLSASDAAGLRNVNAIFDAAAQIRQQAERRLGQGVAVNTVIQEMQQWRTQLHRTALGLGFNVDQLNRLLHHAGLSNEALNAMAGRIANLNKEAQSEAVSDYAAKMAEAAKLTQESTDLLNEHLKNVAELMAENLASIDLSDSEIGRENQKMLLDIVEGIRDFADELFDLGVPVDSIIAQVKAMRQQFLTQATALGFNATALNELISMLGLADSQLAEFVAQLKALEEAANAPLPEPAQRQLPTPIVNIYPPYGDPEAIGLTAVNRLALELAGVG